MIINSPTVQSPKAYDLQNLGSAQLGARLAAGANSTLRGNFRTVLSDLGYRYVIHPAETAAGLVDANITFGFDPLDIRRYGASTSQSQANNKTAIQTAISVGSHLGGVAVIIIPRECEYGYVRTNLTTHPDMSGSACPIVIYDYSPGDSYAGYPNSYDGAQVRVFNHTPTTVSNATWTGALLAGATSAVLAVQFSGPSDLWPLPTGLYRIVFSNGDVRQGTFTAGQHTVTWTGGLSAGGATAAFTYDNPKHDGNGFRVIGTWAPYLTIDNQSGIASPSVNGLDNRRASIFFSADGNDLWQISQGTLSGSGLTLDQISNFAITCFNVTNLNGVGGQSTYVPILIERATGNIGFGKGANNPQASYYFYSVTAGFAQAIWESQSVTSQIYVRNSNGSGDDVGFINRSGQACINISSQGDAISFDKANRRASFGASVQFVRHTPAAGTAFTPDAGIGNAVTLNVNAAGAVTVNAPLTTPAAPLLLMITVRNTSGGVTGAFAWNAIYKMAAWGTIAANTARSIVFLYDVANSVYYQIGATVDTPL